MKPAIALISLFLAAVLYAQDTSLHDILIDGEDWKPAVTGYAFCDGLAADAEGNLFFSDVKSGKGVYKLGRDGKVTLVDRQSARHQRPARGRGRAHLRLPEQGGARGRVREGRRREGTRRRM